MIRLDYYRLLPEIKYIGVVDEPDTDCHFVPYSVFILETRLYPLIYKMFSDIYIEIYLKSIYNKEKNRMDIYLVINQLEDTKDPFTVNKLVNISDKQLQIIQNKINEINSKYIDYALIDIDELYNSMNVSNKKSKNSRYPNLNKKIPFSYFSSILQYTGIDSSFNPFIRPEGIYLSFNSKSDYKKAYYETCDFLIQRVNEFYKKGAIILGNMTDSLTKEELIKNWELISIDSEEIVPTIYESIWIDERFAKNKVDFLTRKIEEDPFIRLRISDNLVKRHGIAQILQKHNVPMIVEGSYLKAEAKNLKEAQKISTLVTSATSLTNGRVLVIASNRLSEIYLYFELAKKKYGDGKCVRYLVDNNENKYMFSCLLSNDVSFDDLRLEFRNYAVNRLIEVSKISKFKNMSPHAIIESEYS